MANLKIYSIYDSKIETYSKPFILINRGEALRAWQDLCNDPTTQMYKYPADFTLFELGTFDDQTGFMERNKTQVSMGVAIEFKKQENINPVDLNC